MQRIPGTDRPGSPDWLAQAEKLVDEEDRRQREAGAPSLINPETPKKAWTPEVKLDLAHAVFSEHTLKGIARASQCRLKWKGRAIQISIPEGGDLDVALAHLSSVDEAYVSTRRI